MFLNKKDLELDELNGLREAVKKAYFNSKKEELRITSKYKDDHYITKLKEDIDEINSKKGISFNTLLKFLFDNDNRRYRVSSLEAIKKYIKHFLPNDQSNHALVKLKDWNVSTNFSSPQRTAYIKIPVEGGVIKRVRFEVQTSSSYYRIGFKLFRTTGKLFGDGSIQSMDNNFIIHIGKNFMIDELFITTYMNGIRQEGDNYTKIAPKKNKYSVELLINAENLLSFFINGKEVFEKIINPEIREQIYMLVWGDENEYRVSIKKIEFEY